ncbi:K(+) efflux antiporter 4 [Camellia lanceoleosa]|uniref:K(+) efflux antiporter 4 n=1 Tax=Camellia lanceoleosa TaxID=1840588 RepID=A0ACC0F7A3_9ERIC|nr:K(+) efflux antiporter 4 [Camellia lanceoleosa]
MQQHNLEKPTAIEAAVNEVVVFNVAFVAESKIQIYRCFCSTCSDKLGLSLELGSFTARVMILIIDLVQHTLEQVGMSLAQIGEFVFVLLSRASNLHLVEVSAIITVSPDNVFYPAYA